MRHRSEVVFVARLVCSDAGCAQAFTARAADPRELEALACACGCALQVLGWPEPEPEPEPRPGPGEGDAALELVAPAA